MEMVQGQQNAGKERVEIAGADVGAAGAGALGASQQLRRRVAQFGRKIAGLRRDVDAVAGQRVRSLAVHQTVESEAIVAEFDLEGEIVATGQTHRLPYIQALRVRDGRIVSLRDDIDDPALAALIGGLPEPLAAPIVDAN